MLKYTLKRFFIAVVTLYIIITITFFLVRLMPGDPFTGTKRIPEEIMKNMEKKYGLDQPLIIQYVKYMGQLLKGNFGESLYYKGRSVNTILSTTFSVSAKLGTLAIVSAAFSGILIGVIAGLNRGRIFDYIVIIIAVIGVSVPNYVFASVFQYFFASRLKMLPVAGWGTLKHLIMPVMALSVTYLAYIARMMRTSMLEVVNQDYIKTARAKGLSKGRILRKHTLRNAILPVVTILGAAIAGVLIGSLVIENIFGIPGMGKYFVQSIQQNDYTMTMGITVFYAVLLIAMLFLVDVLYGIIDPRIRLD